MTVVFLKYKKTLNLISNVKKNIKIYAISFFFHLIIQKIELITS